MLDININEIGFTEKYFTLDDNEAKEIIRFLRDDKDNIPNLVIDESYFETFLIKANVTIRRISIKQKWLVVKNYYFNNYLR